MLTLRQPELPWLLAWAGRHLRHLELSDTRITSLQWIGGSVNCVHTRTATFCVLTLLDAACGTQHLAYAADCTQVHVESRCSAQLPDLLAPRHSGAGVPQPAGLHGAARHCPA